MFTFLFNFFTRSIVVLLVAMMSVNYLPDNLFNDFPLDPKAMEPNDYDKVIPQWNTKLSDGQPEFIQLNNLLGPESIAFSKGGLIYTGLADGRIVELDPAKSYKMRKVLKFKDVKDCPDNIATKADECGRFLQLRFVNDTLYGIESNTGLYKIDHKTGSKTFMGPKALSKIAMFNCFAFDPKEPNLVYITISSTKWKLQDIFWSFMDLESSGQVIALDINSGKRVVVASGLTLANGIDVDTKRDRMIFAETLKSRINSISLKDVRAQFILAKNGDKMANIHSTALIPLMPGNPDNIMIEGDLAYIALPFVKTNGKELTDHMATMPGVRKAISRFLFGSGKLLEYLNNLYPHPLIESAFRELKCGHVNYRLIQTDKSGVVEYNLATGASRFFGSNTFGFVSEAVPDNKGSLFLGSFRSSFLVKQKI